MNNEYIGTVIHYDFTPFGKALKIYISILFFNLLLGLLLYIIFILAYTRTIQKYDINLPLIISFLVYFSIFLLLVFLFLWTLVIVFSGIIIVVKQEDYKLTSILYESISVVLHNIHSLIFLLFGILFLGILEFLNIEYIHQSILVKIVTGIFSSLISLLSIGILIMYYHDYRLHSNNNKNIE